MSEVEDNKTRIRKAADSKSSGNPDLTKAPSPKTKIRQKKTATSSQTRVKPVAQDTTQYKPATRKAAVNTPASPSKANQHSYSYENNGAGHHGVLKERFILAKIIGSGGMGVVYKAKDLLKVEAKDRDPYVAIKVLSEEFKAHPEAFISLQRESRKSQRIAHPNIVNVFDFDRDGDVVFMTMEYMDGKPLDQIIRQYRSTGLPTEDAWNILKSMCRALLHAHAEKIIHSDFKPGNIFVTNKGVTKVFDFGIARAVAKVTKNDDAPEDRTVFDAGNLGALTPAYASLEMLEGKKPDTRDDIYALGCIAYELFAGRHPFNKVPADEAKKQGLEPEKINNISKRQWRAIKQCLAFKREDRMASVEEFLDLISTTITRNYSIPIVLLLIALISTIGYMQFNRDTPTGLSESEIRSKVEYEIQLNFHKNTINRLLSTPDFTPSWEDQLWLEFVLFKDMLQNIEKWVSATESRATRGWFVVAGETAFNQYLGVIRKNRLKGNFKRTEVLIVNAARYSKNGNALDVERKLLAAAIEKHKLNKKRRMASKQREETTQSKVQTAKKKRVELFNIALNNVNQQLRCQSKLNMRNIDVAIKKLKSYNNRKYKRLKPGIIHKLASCITELGKPFPAKAQEYKKYALRIFNRNKAIVAIQITPRDPCNTSIAGLGGRGKRTVCKDKFHGVAGTGPDLIVVIGRGNMGTFAIGKYEISIKEMNMFCRRSDACNAINGKDTSLPVTNISFSTAKDYMRWLTKKTRKKYRLATKNEWLYAASARRKSLDPNRNCYLRTRGIEKGEELFGIKVGKPNSWGMVNYIGNAREWVYGKGRKLVAVGGSYNAPMESCQFDTMVSSTGNADIYTGFRVLREVQK
ncbi:Serine/threonine protein kinase [hydrothermal vent metagenome]|uniref:Serine/threonine protein kinase n=1 Tax=hydrothermal vent metagenome TaxID=652676 RepID=A0A3B0ZSE6_9ZZZZ